MFICGKSGNGIERGFGGGYTNTDTNNNNNTTNTTTNTTRKFGVCCGGIEFGVFGGFDGDLQQIIIHKFVTAGEYFDLFILISFFCDLFCFFTFGYC